MDRCRSLTRNIVFRPLQRVARRPGQDDPVYRRKGPTLVLRSGGFCSFEPVVELENPIRLEDCGDLPTELTVWGTGQVAGENVGG